MGGGGVGGLQLLLLGGRLLVQTSETALAAPAKPNREKSSYEAGALMPYSVTTALHFKATHELLSGFHNVEFDLIISKMIHRRKL